MMVNKTFIFVVLGLSVITLFSSCKKDREVMSRGKMEAVLYDMQLAQSVYDNKRSDFNSDEKKKALFDAVLEKHEITQAVLDSSLVHYADDMKTYLKMNDSIASRLKVEKAVYDKELDDKMSLEEHSKQRQRFVSYYHLIAANPTYSFSLDSTSTQGVDIPSLSQISFQVLGESSNMTLNSYLQLHYVDTIVVLPFVADSETSVYKVDILPVDTLGSILQSLSGYVHVTSAHPDFDVLIHDIRFVSNDSVIQMPSAAPIKETDRRLRNSENIYR